MPGSAITDLRRRLELLNAAKRRANRIAAVRSRPDPEPPGWVAGVDREAGATAATATTERITL